MDDIDALLRRFRQDFEFYAPRALQIRTKSGAIVPLRLNRAQRFVHAKLEHQLAETGRIRALVLKGRQQGMSTYIEGRFYWRTSGSAGKRAAILTHEDKATANLFGMARLYHDLCPPELKPNAQYASATALYFDVLRSGYEVATARTKNTGRSQTLQFFHGSEVAFWDNADTHMAGLGQAVPDMPGTEIILESTANGMGNLFHKMWLDAQAGRGDYIPIFIPWYWQEEYQRPVPQDFVLTPEEAEYQENFGLTLEQMAWRRAKLENDFRGSVALFDQEYPATPQLAFSRVEGEPVLPTAWIIKARKTRGLEARGAVIMGVDPAEYGADDTVIVVRRGRVILYQIRRHGLSPMEVVGLAAKTAEAWKPDLINVDAGGLGSGIADRLIELEYPVNRILFGERAIERELYMLRRDEMAGEMRRWFEDGPVQIPDDDAFCSDLTIPTYTHDSSRRFKVESKEHIKDIRKLPSPDAFDATGLTFAVPTPPNYGQQRKKAAPAAPSWKVAG